MPAQNTAQPAMRLETPRGPLIKADVLVAQLAQLFEKVKDIEKDGKKVQDMTVKEIKERMAQSPNIAAMIIAEFYNNNWDKFLEIR